MSLDRRTFLRRLVVGGVAFSVANTLDPEFWVWTPGAKTILVPEVIAPAGVELVQVLGYQVLRFGAQECVVARRSATPISSVLPPTGGVQAVPMGACGSLERIPVVGFADGAACVEVRGKSLEVAQPGSNILGVRVRDGKFVALTALEAPQTPRYIVYPRASRPVEAIAGMSGALTLGLRPPLSSKGYVS